jgi:hypothetical protein
MSDTRWRIGETVAWSTAWSRETAFALRPSTDFPGMTEVSQIDRQGHGEPNFAAVHVDRQRRGLADHRCHVCGRPTPEDDRWMFPVASGDFVTLHDGRTGFGCNVPPLHRACADKAAILCPHLDRLAEKPTRWPAGPTRLIWRTDVAPGMEALAATFPPGKEIVYSCYRLFEPEAADAIRAVREAWDRETRERLTRMPRGSSL